MPSMTPRIDNQKQKNQESQNEQDYHPGPMLPNLREIPGKLRKIHFTLNLHQAAKFGNWSIIAPE